MRIRKFAVGMLTRLMAVALAVLFIGCVTAVALPDPQPANSKSSAPTAAPIQFWNRTITYQRSPLAGLSASERASRAMERLGDLPLHVAASDILLRSVKIEDQDGVAFVSQGQMLFFLGAGDLDKESGETLDQASRAAVRNLDQALRARVEERSWPIVRSGIIFTIAGLLLLVAFCVVVWKAQNRIIHFAQKRHYAFSSGLPIFGFDILPYLAAIVYSLVRTSAWLLTLIAAYLWATLSLRQFPYTEPWGYEAGSYVIGLLQNLASAAIHALPGLLAVVVIFTVTRWCVRLAGALFDQIASGKISVYWMDADVAHATKRIFAAIIWVFAVIVAYPYIPGSQTEAFKGISVFFGLVVSLGSTGIINQVMSGLFVVYSKALKTGDWVKVNETEGEVLEVGLLAAKVRTIEGQEVTIPNSVLVGTSTTNFTRLGHPDGMIASVTVTIGYDAPWRQVHALLLRAADRTPNVHKHPAPYILQRALSDFYVGYTLIVRLEDEKRRIESISDLNAQIQDAFNEFGVQIMSPHYMVQPDNSVVIPPAKWHEPPAEPKS